MSCNYQGHEFGARYLDSVCIDGVLFDADACDGEGNLYEPLDYIPCPGCRPLVAMDWYADNNLGGGNASWPRYYAWHLVADIRKNRGMRTLPFLLWLPWRLIRELRDWWHRA